MEASNETYLPLFNAEIVDDPKEPIKIFTADGTLYMTINAAYEKRKVAWSPDGRKIAVFNNFSIKKGGIILDYCINLSSINSLLPRRLIGNPEIFYTWITQKNIQLVQGIFDLSQIVFIILSGSKETTTSSRQ